MKDFIQKVLTELNSNHKIKSNSLVKIVTESVNKSIQNKESYDSIYKKLKTDLYSINEHLKSQTIGILLSQFDKNEDTTDSIINRMTKIGDLRSELALIKESNSYSNPIIASTVNKFESLLDSNIEFKLYPSFVNEFSNFPTEKQVNKSVSNISKILETNAEQLEILFNIYEMSGVHSALYNEVIHELKEMLVNESYSSDIINLKFGKTNLPIVKNLVNSLKVLESKKSGSFTLGAGDVNNVINDMIAPVISVSKGNIIAFIDDRFIRVSESNESSYGDTIHINESGFTISTVNPNIVEDHSNSFYSLCESYAKLGFKQEGDMAISKSIRNFKIGLTFNESKKLDIYLNDSKIESIDSINMSEALVMESNDIKRYVNTLFENIDKILNLKFIKNVSNDRVILESTIFELNGKYFLCKKLNSAEREWSKVDEHEMYTYFKNNYNYDISSIYSNAINEANKKVKVIENRKISILENVSKLEGSISEINDALKSPKIQKDAIKKLEKLKESIQYNISSLEEEYVELDLSKK